MSQPLDTANSPGSPLDNAPPSTAASHQSIQSALSSPDSQTHSDEDESDTEDALGKADAQSGTDLEEPQSEQALNGEETDKTAGDVLASTSNPQSPISIKSDNSAAERTTASDDDRQGLDTADQTVEESPYKPEEIPEEFGERSLDIRKSRRHWTFRQKMIRLISLYAIPVVLTIPLALSVHLNSLVLTPLYNSLPLRIHQLSLHILFAIPPSLLYWAITLYRSPRDAFSGLVCFSLAAMSEDVVSVLGRRIGSLTGRLAGAEMGALMAQMTMGAGSVAGCLGFALLCFDHILPISAARTKADKVKNLLNVSLRSALYMSHLWLIENVLGRLLGSRMSSLTSNPEKSLLFISLLFTVIALIVRASTGVTPFPKQIQDLLRTLPISPAALKTLTKAARKLPRRALPLILFLRLPFLILVLRQQLFLRPSGLSSEPYVTARGELRILSSEMSLTGRIVVADNLKDNYRFLRCDNSILGGRWIRERNGKTEMGDTIFAVFNLQEVATLAHRSNSKESLIHTLSLTTDLQVEAEGEDEAADARPIDRALVIGLGVGISAQGFLRRGMDVDVVEIDPEVYRAATTYFDLSESRLSSSIMMDGATFISEAAALARVNVSDPDTDAETLAAMELVPRWNYVVQDCFTGGAVPGEMFTVEFWEELSELLVEDGIVAMNFVGLRRSKASKAVLVTLLSVFPQCRAFSEGFEANLGPDAITNMVVFCTRTYSPILTFRPPKPSDVHRSPLKSHVFSTFLLHEIYLDEIVTDDDFSDPELTLRRGKTEKLDIWQTETGLATWSAMQKILTPEMWLAY
ncbi:hypothetical protein I350_02025 [Cryptococcus amylolentus CBS 6273]|uniref:PABS domain-containing protein n=1 Tax=Cryptococcus amylolentus CBS 6273 TaxID=1296118 RepID=A0A1E3K9E5_9TREE|nr:hypothetical protein I350_02025 [Cryptococcus amylolentus CBS 6273]